MLKQLQELSKGEKQFDVKTVEKNHKDLFSKLKKHYSQVKKRGSRNLILELTMMK